MLPITFDIMLPMQQQSFILLHPMVKEKMHLQVNTLLDLDLRVKVTGNVAQCPLHHVIYAPTEFEVTTSKGLGGEGFTNKFNILTFDHDLGVKATQNYAHYPLHHLTYPATKDEVATSNRLGGGAFTRKFDI